METLGCSETQFPISGVLYAHKNLRPAGCLRSQVSSGTLHPERAWIPQAQGSVLQGCATQSQAQACHLCFWLAGYRSGSHKPLLGFNLFARVAHRTQAASLLGRSPAYYRGYDSGIARWKRSTGKGMWEGQGASLSSEPTTPCTSTCSPNLNPILLGPFGFLWKSHHMLRLVKSLVIGDLFNLQPLSAL